MSRCTRIWVGLLALVLPLVACASATAPAPPVSSAAPTFPITVQNCGEQVSIAKEPKRIVTAGHEAVELINAAGEADRIVGAFDNTKDPDSPAFKAASHAEITSDREPTAENILALRADLVVSYGLSASISPASLQQAGTASLVVSGLCGQHGGGQGSGASFDKIYGDVQTFGRLFGTQAQAQAAVDQLKARVAAVAREGGGRTAGHGYFYGSTFSTSGNQSTAQTQMDTLGLHNVFSDVAKDFIEANSEELIKRDPQIMILTYYLPDETFEQAKAKFLALPGAKDMQAVRTNRIIPLPYVQTQPTVSAVTGLETIASGLRAATG